MAGFQLEVEIIKKAGEGFSSMFNKPRNGAAPAVPMPPPAPPVK
jgi:hypothetical protein